MIFWVSSPVSLIDWEVFHRLVSCPVFFPSFPIIGLEGFSIATWTFETHQLLYGARMFSMVSRFSSPVSFIGLGGFLLSSHLLLTISRSTELVSKERGNYNNVISERRVPKVEVTWQQSSKTSHWSVWPLLYRLTQSSSHSEPRFLLN